LLVLETEGTEGADIVGAEGTVGAEGAVGAEGVSCEDTGCGGLVGLGSEAGESK